MKKYIALSLLISLTFTIADDWTMWGGKVGRNMVNDVEKNLPAKWDEESGENIKWIVELGSQSYGNPVISNGKVFVGSNNEGLKDPKVKGDKGNILCFRETDGKFLWQAIHDKLTAGRVNDWPLQGICSTPAIEGDRLYYVSNRCEVVCADTEGFYDDENDGIQDEKYKGKDKADIVWTFDMIEELGVFPHNLATSSPIVVGDLVYLLTSNGVDEGHLNIPSPRAPSFIAINKKTGELVWENGDPADKILHGQWSSPAYGVVKGRAQVICPGGDGLVYSLDPKTGDVLWTFDCNPKDAVWELGGHGTRNNLVSTPVIFNDKVYIGVGQDPEHGEGIGHLWAIDATGSGDVTKTHAVWHIGGKDFGRTMSTAAIKDGLMYNCDLAGFMYCIDVEKGEVLWKHDMEAAIWGSTIIVDGKVYLGDEDGDIVVFAHGREKKVLGESILEGTVYTTPSPANGTLYIATQSKLYAVALPPAKKDGKKDEK